MLRVKSIMLKDAEQQKARISELTDITDKWHNAVI
jgi:hypothetical protein